MHIHLNILLLLGLALFGGTIGGRIFQKLKIPQVVGYIAIGLLIGQSGLKLVDSEILRTLQPFNYFALGLIGFMVGGELKKEIFVRYGRQLIYILLSEGITPFVLVTVLVGTAGMFIFGNWQFAWAMALLMGAIASATDPATTTQVLSEYKTRGPLTTTILGIVALDDGLALGLFVIASSIAQRLIGAVHSNLLWSLLHMVYELGGSVVVGALAGFILLKILRNYSEKAKILIFSIGTVLFVTGLSLTIKLDMLLTLMTIGIIVVNFAPRKSKDVFQIIEGFAPPIFVLFFVLVGAKLNIRAINLPILALAGIYLFGTMTGKVIGSKFGAHISEAAQTVKQYLPLCLFAQAGIAIGLSILAAHYFPNEIGNTLVIVITTTTFTLQIIGPFFTKIGITKAGEVGLNVTEQDLIERSKARDIMDLRPPVISEDKPLGEILKVFTENTYLYYPVVDKDKKLRGIITVDGIRHTILESGLSNLLVAHDLMEPVVATISPQGSMTEVKDALSRYNLEYLPVVSVDRKLEGFIESRMLNKFISTKIIELQKQVDSLG